MYAPSARPSHSHVLSELLISALGSPVATYRTKPLELPEFCTIGTCFFVAEYDAITCQRFDSRLLVATSKLEYLESALGSLTSHGAWKRPQRSRRALLEWPAGAARTGVWPMRLAPAGRAYFRRAAPL